MTGQVRAHRARSDWFAGNHSSRCASPGPSRRTIPTPSGVPEFLEISPSSSSSPVWKLGIGPLRAGQRPDRVVCGMWAADGVLLSTRGQLDGRAPSAPAVHDLSPVHPRDIPTSRPVPRRPGLSPAAMAFGQVTGRSAPTVHARPTRLLLPDVTWRTRDLPNLCTSLGTTPRRVDTGPPREHRTGAYHGGGRPRRPHRTPVDKSTPGDAPEGPSCRGPDASLRAVGGQGGPLTGGPGS
jgi:hypothetical protein